MEYYKIIWHVLVSMLGMYLIYDSLGMQPLFGILILLSVYVESYTQSSLDEQVSERLDDIDDVLDKHYIR